MNQREYVTIIILSNISKRLKNEKNIHQSRFPRQNSVLAVISPNKIVSEAEGEAIIKKREQRQYKDDLDYLCSLKQKKKSQDEYYKEKEDELLFIKNEYHDDKKYQHFLLKQFNDYNLQEAINKRNKALVNKQRSINEDIIASNEVKLQESIAKETQRRKRHNIQAALEIALQQHNDILEQKNIKLMNEKQKEQTLLQGNGMSNDNYQKYKTKIEQYNGKIYNRVRDFNGYINSQEKGINPISYPLIKSDDELNKLISEQKANEKRRLLSKRKTPQEMKEEMRLLQQEDDNIRRTKLNRQRCYKDLLDSQTQFKIKRNALSKDIENNSRNEQLLMPGYNYHSNEPFQFCKKAYEPLKRNLFLSHDYSSKDIYLGRSVLKRNPILLPINDIEYNQYVLNDLQRLKDYPRNSIGNHFNTYSYNR